MNADVSSRHSTRRCRSLGVAAMLAMLALSAAREVEGAESAHEDPAFGVHGAIDLPGGDKRGMRAASISDHGVLPYLAHLVLLSGNGMLDVERAAFLVEENGRFRCELWPFDNGHRRTTYRGAVPGGTVAIAHTHPIELPMPSEHDRKEAVRLGLPMLVVSRWSVYEVTAEGQVRALARNRRWIEDAGEGASCESVDSGSGTRAAGREQRVEHARMATGTTARHGVPAGTPVRRAAGAGGASTARR